MNAEDSGAELRGVDPATGGTLDPPYRESGSADVDRALCAASDAADDLARAPAVQRAAFLRAAAEELVALGDTLLNRAHVETALPLARLQGERIRTVNQLRLFADHIEEGSWVEARIDTADPARAPVPRPDVRRMLVPIGPVVVFAASNFPLAFSVPGGDTASALAAGCPVVCKAHPAHPGTSELAAGAIARAASRSGLPTGVFGLVQGWSHDVGLAMVRHRFTRAVGFTGSLRAGRAIVDAAAAREDPIPVYAEMGSINPVFLLPSALAEQNDKLADGLVQAITLGVGQFCTNPGVLVGPRGDALDRLSARLAERIGRAESGTMLYARLHEAYERGLDRARALGAAVLASGPAGTPGRARPALLAVQAERFLASPELGEEIFGPVSLVVSAEGQGELVRVAESLEGQLTATIHGSARELEQYARLVDVLRRKAGRLIFNGFPTGVEVGHAMHHGGPWPASSDARTTSVGSAAIARFARPVCYQNFPEASLPPALRNRNTLGIWRLVDGRTTRDDLPAA